MIYIAPISRIESEARVRSFVPYASLILTLTLTRTLTLTLTPNPNTNTNPNPNTRYLILSFLRNVGYET